MKETSLGILCISVAFLLNHIISQFNPFILQFVNLYSIPIIYLAIKKNDFSTIIMASTAGILEDISSILPIGVNALKKLILIFTLGKISKMISINSTLGYWLIFFLSVTFEVVILILITGFFGLKDPLGGFRELILIQPLITSIIGAPFFKIFSKLTEKE